MTSWQITMILTWEAFRFHPSPTPFSTHPPFLFPPPLPRPFSATPSKSSALVQLVFVVSFTLKTAGPSIRLVHACTCLPRTSKRRKSRGGSLSCRVTHSTKRGRKMALALHCPQQQTALERPKQKNIFIGIEGWRNDQTRMSMSMTLWTRSPTLTKIFLQTHCLCLRSPAFRSL